MSVEDAPAFDIYRAWIATMLRVMDKIEIRLGAASPTEYATGYEALVKHVQEIHWDESAQMYTDRGLMEYPNNNVAEGGNTSLMILILATPMPASVY